MTKTIKVKIADEGKEHICSKCYFFLLCKVYKYDASNAPCALDEERAYFQEEEPINEEELDRLALEHSEPINKIPDDWFNKRRVELLVRSAYEAGYRKAKGL